MALCPNCNDEMRVIPAGVSKKTGKAYRAFEVCEKLACKQLKEASRYNVPPSSQNVTQSNFNPLQATVDDLQRKVDDQNLVIQKMREAFANHEYRIAKLEPNPDNIPDDFFDVDRINQQKGV